MRPVPTLLALALGVLAAFAVACGGDGGSSAGLLRSADASGLKSELDAVDAAVAENDCGRTEQALNAVGSAIRNLPESTDERVLARLRTGYGDLRSTALRDCKQPRQETTTVETTTTTEPPEETTPATTEEVPVTPDTQTTAPPAAPPTETTPPAPDDGEGETPEGTGGVEPGEGPGVPGGGSGGPG